MLDISPVLILSANASVDDRVKGLPAARKETLAELNKNLSQRLREAGALKRLELLEVKSRVKSVAGLTARFFGARRCALPSCPTPTE